MQTLANLPATAASGAPRSEDPQMAGIDRLGKLGTLSLALALGASQAHAAATPDKAAQLGTTLTEIGAEKSGSADGSIPQYTGGLPKLHATVSKGEFDGADPFAGEKPLRVITNADADAASAQLTAGTRELLRRYPTFRVDVYPTHRTATLPDWLLTNTRTNATAARSSDDGLKFKDVLPGVPFPIPGDGSEVMWNHRMRYMGRAIGVKYENWLEDAAGQSVMVGAAQGRWELPTTDVKHRATTILPDDPMFKWRGDYTGPQRRAGEVMALLEVANPMALPRQVWSYVPGQRRVKLLNMPDDTPSSSSSGAYIVDDAFVFNGSLDRFDVKLLGKRAMLVPYNDYRFILHSAAGEYLRPGHVNPDVVRWELHRVWVVEATLKPGQHHPYGRRVFYVDEDTWTAVASDEYDATGQLVRSVYVFPIFGLESGTPFACTFVSYSFDASNYYVGYHPVGSAAVEYVAPLRDADWSPDAIAGQGVR